MTLSRPELLVCHGQYVITGIRSGWQRLIDKTKSIHIWSSEPCAGASNIRSYPSHLWQTLSRVLFTENCVMNQQWSCANCYIARPRGPQLFFWWICVRVERLLLCSCVGNKQIKCRTIVTIVSLWLELVKNKQGNLWRKQKSKHYKSVKKTKKQTLHVGGGKSEQNLYHPRGIFILGTSVFTFLHICLFSLPCFGIHCVMFLLPQL